MKNKKMDVQGKEIAVIAQNNDDYISLTDIARYKDPDRTDYIIQNWIRSRTTIESVSYTHLTLPTKRIV